MPQPALPSSSSDIFLPQALETPLLPAAMASNLPDQSMAMASDAVGLLFSLMLSAVRAPVSFLLLLPQL